MPLFQSNFAFIWLRERAKSDDDSLNHFSLGKPRFNLRELEREIRASLRESSLEIDRNNSVLIKTNLSKIIQASQRVGRRDLQVKVIA